MTEEFQKTNPLARGDKNIKPLEVYAEHAEIRKQVYSEIRQLYDLPFFRQFWKTDNIIQKFLDCLTPLKNLHDPGRLPIYTTVPRSSIPDKQSCVWALVSSLIQAYWRYELDDPKESKATVLVFLDDLKMINEHYPEMKIAGVENKGYWLELD